jgi:hypothetical protein
MRSESGNGNEYPGRRVICGVVPDENSIIFSEQVAKGLMSYRTSIYGVSRI